MIELSVVICTYNPRPLYLRRVLEALRDQTLALSQWELLLVDNASTEPLATTWDLSWHPNARHILETKRGVAYARQRGIRESSADVVVFVDDDNVLYPDYLSEAKKVGNDWPELGVWGSGATNLELECEPPDHLREFLPFLALRDVKVPYWSNVSTCLQATPWGAGLCLRASVATAYLELAKRSLIQISGRSGRLLLGGEDDELAHVACFLGLGIGIFPELKIKHLISQERITEEYLVRLREGLSTSRFLLDYKWRGTMPLSPFTPVGFLTAVGNIIRYRGVRRRMYFADLRATLKARHMIAASQSH